MNDALKMQISAFVDGELPDNETELLLRRLSQDAELREQVASYLNIGRLMRQEAEVPHMSDLRGRILAELGEEPLETVEAEDVPRSGLTRPAVGFAIAASVALVAILGLQQVNVTEQVVPGEAPVAEISEPAITVPAVNEELLEMQRHHNRSASDLGSGDMLSRFASFELDEAQLDEVTPQTGAQDDADGDADEDDSESGSSQAADQ